MISVFKRLVNLYDSKMPDLNNSHRILIKGIVLDNYYYSTTTSVLQH